MDPVQIDENTSSLFGFSCTGTLLSREPMIQSPFYSHKNSAEAYHCSESQAH